MSTRNWDVSLRIGLVISIITISINISCSQEDVNSETNNEWPILKGTYFGLSDPGNIPQLFGEGYISIDSNHEFGCAFSPNGEEYYFTRREPGDLNKLYITKLVDNIWSKPEQIMVIVPRASEAHISTDNTRLFFGTPSGLYISIRSGETWQDPSMIGPGMYISSTASGTIYYTNVSAVPYAPFIVKRHLENGNFSDEIKVNIESVSDNVAHPFISAQEDYLILNIDGDLYISTTLNEDVWETPTKLNNEINSSSYEFAPYVTPDGEYFFFCRGNASSTNIYWVDADVLFE